MLSENQMVTVRRAIERMYMGICTITGKQKVQNADKSTVVEDVIVCENVPCKLSFSSVKSGEQGDISTGVVQAVKIFLAPEILVKSGSQFTITQHGMTGQYESSGQPAQFGTHQEIGLLLSERRA